MLSPPPPAPVQLDLVDGLVQASGVIQAVLKELADACDASVLHVRLLGVLRDRTPTMAELGRLMELDKSSTTGLVDRTEARRVVRRVPDEADGRVVRVELTPEGRRLVEASALAVAARIDALTSDLDADQREALAGMLSAMVRRYAQSKDIDLMAGTVAGSVDGSVAGSVDGSVAGSVDGSVAGSVDGSVAGSVDGSVAGSVDGSVAGSVDGSVAGSVDGSVAGSVDGSVAGSVDGSVAGSASDPPAATGPRIFAKGGRVAVVIGSTRPGRICPGIAGWVRDALAGGSPLTYELVDLADVGLPMLDEPLPAALHTYAHPHTEAWSSVVDGYGGFVFVFPQYNWGYPAALKNALDFLYDEWADKPASMVCYGTRGGNRAVAQLATVLQGLDMRQLDDHLEVKITHGDVDANWQLKNLGALMAPYRAQARAIDTQMAEALTLLA